MSETKVYKKKAPPSEVRESKKGKRKQFIINQSPWLFPVFLSVIFLLLVAIDTTYQKRIEETVLPGSIASVPLSTYPFLREIRTPAISAEAAIIMHEPSRAILYAKNPDLRFAMASTTKVMTALTALDHYQLSDVLTVNTSGVGGALVGFTNGEKVTFENVLYGLLLPSGNDAAYTIARNYPGGLSNFVKKMNEKAAELGLTNTEYSDPAGLNDDYGFTTVIDLARLSAVALKNQVIKRIAGTKQYTITTVDGLKTYRLDNLNKLLGVDGVNGLKTGFTERAGEVLVTTKEENNETFIIVVMKSKDRFADTRELIALFSGNLSYFNPGDKLQVLN